jgi:hypothetical protein
MDDTQLFIAQIFGHDDSLYQLMDLHGAAKRRNTENSDF